MPGLAPGARGGGVRIRRESHWQSFAGMGSPRPPISGHRLRVRLPGGRELSPGADVGRVSFGLHRVAAGTRAVIDSN